MNRTVVLFFGFSWLGVIAGSATPFGALEGTYIGPTKYCTTMVKNDYIFAMSVTSFINDTLILLAITYKLGVADAKRSLTSPIFGALLIFLSDWSDISITGRQQSSLSLPPILLPNHRLDL